VLVFIKTNSHINTCLNIGLGGGMSKLVVRRGDVKTMRNSIYMFYWQCPKCGKMIINDSVARVLMSIKLHMSRKHGVDVEVTD